MQAKGDMDSETFSPSFYYLFCIYFSKFLAPLLHLIFDANLHLFPHFGELFGAFLAPWPSGTPLAPVDAKTEACVGPVGSILEPLGGLWAVFGQPLSSILGALASICDPLLPKMAPK